MWALSFFTGQVLRDDMTQLLSAQQFSTVSLVGKNINEEMQNRVMALQQVATLIDGKLLSQVDLLQAKLEDRPVTRQLFNGGFYVADIHGTAIASVPFSAKRAGLNYMERPHVRAALKEGKNSISDVVIGKALNVPVFSVAVPVRDTQGTIIGALVGVINLDQSNFLDKIISNPYGTTGGYVLVAPKQRLIVTATDKTRIMELLPAPGINPQIDRLIDGYEGSMVLVNPLGVKVLVSARGIPLSGWYVAAFLPTAEAFSPINDVQQRMRLATLLLTVMAGGLIWWLVRRELAPMQSAAEALGHWAGSASTPSALPISQPDEIGDLVGGFNRLLQTLSERENALKKSETRLSTIAAMTSDLVYSCVRSADGLFRIDWIGGNAGPVFGYDTASVIQRGCWRPFVVAADLPVFARAITGLQPGQTSKEIMRVEHADGTQHWVHSVARVEDDPYHSGQHRLYGSLRDITERKNTEIELHQHRHHLEEMVNARTVELAAARDDAEAASRAKSTFLANMSHELRTPMTAIMGMVDLVMRKNTDPKQLDQLTKAKLASQHLLMVINNILDISKIEADRMTLESLHFKFAEVLENLVSLIGHKFSEKGLTLRVDVAPDLDSLAFLGDPLRLGQILLNFTANALKFTEQGEITVRLRLVENNASDVLVRGEVIDSGIGIAADDQPRLFSAFEQADGSMTRKYGGTGLGLAISQRLAKLMGGNVGVVSEVGQGSTFWFTARLKKDRHAVPSAPTIAHDPAEAQLKAGFAGARILLAEDEPVNREVSLGMLEDVGLSVDVAEDGAVALALSRQHRYAAILMDMQMPNLNGVDATRAIRAESLNADTPILAMTANAFDEDRQRCLDAGMNDHIAKPVEPNRLFEALLKWLSRTA